MLLQYINQEYISLELIILKNVQHILGMNASYFLLYQHTSVRLWY